MGWSCDVCDGEGFTEQDGLYYCDVCGTQPQVCLSGLSHSFNQMVYLWNQVNFHNFFDGFAFLYRTDF